MSIIDSSYTSSTLSDFIAQMQAKKETQQATSSSEIFSLDSTSDVNSVSSSSVQGMAPPPPPPEGTSFTDESGNFDEEAFLEKFTSDFGEDAVASITNEDGEIDFTKVKEFFDTQLSSSEGTGAPSGPPPMGGPGGGDMPSSDDDDEDDYLSAFEQTFGSDALAQITDSSGNLDFEELKSYFEENGISQDDFPPPPPPSDMTSATTSSSDDLSSLIASTSTDDDTSTSYSNTSSMFSAYLASSALGTSSSSSLLDMFLSGTSTLMNVSA